jgi:hypothetical protein
MDRYHEVEKAIEKRHLDLEIKSIIVHHRLRVSVVERASIIVTCSNEWTLRQVGEIFVKLPVQRRVSPCEAWRS